MAAAAVNRDGDIGLADRAGRRSIPLGLFRGPHCPFCRRQGVQMGGNWSPYRPPPRPAGFRQDRRAYPQFAPLCDWVTEGFDTTDPKDAKALLEALK